jgi:Cu2+-exporting ATPase
VPKGPGDEVVAGSINREAPLVVQVKRVGAATVAQGIVRLMQQAQGQRVEGLGVLNWVAARFTAAVLLLAAGAGLGWAWGEPSRALWVAVSVLVVTCPCALTLAAPSAWLAASGALARRGLLLTRLDLLERLNDIDTVVFDKTGTLSDGRLQLLGMDADGEVEASLLSRARGLAAQSRHPYSQAIARADLAAGWTAVKELPGCGLEALDAQGRLSRLGRPDWVASLSGRAVPADRQLAFGTADAALWLRLGETLRADAAEAVAQLQAQGLQVHLLSGDAEAAVRRVANTLNIPHWQAALSPEGKLAAVRGLQAAGGRVLMVGDGINDAPVLAAADLRVVMGQGALLARATADALLLSNRLVDLPLARRHARRTRKVLRQNLAWAAVYNFACVPLAVAGWLSPLAAGLGMALSSLLVVLNARRLSHT